MEEIQHTLTLEGSREELALLGSNDRNIKRIREEFGIRVFARDGVVRMHGEPRKVQQAIVAFDDMLKHFRRNQRLLSDDVEKYIRAARHVPMPEVASKYKGGSGWLVSPKTKGQECYLKAMESNQVVFCIGPAGTGKTYLAVSMAISLLRAGEIRKIVLARPAVEAGEKLGFLPGDLQEKVNPYLRPLYDALNDLLDFGQTKRYMERDIIEVVPLAFMRGRTLNHSFVILDEAQNSTTKQMKMFLTRLGIDSRAVITGDVTQVDLRTDQKSGLSDAREILDGIKGLDFVYLEKQDVVRHRIVQDIVEAYERHDNLRSPISENTGSTEALPDRRVMNNSNKVDAQPLKAKPMALDETADQTS
ncbi:MAG: PhoH family protein [Planctomycetota bacterium]|nr:PhoH family protein [Planctomycetota bacterium]MDA1138768.1 PhoH family protein [Planctomycetota bacterium]